MNQGNNPLSKAAPNQPMMPMRPMPLQGPMAMQQAQAITPRDIYLILIRHWFLIIVCIILGACCGVGGWYLTKKYAPKYTATVFIEVLEPGLDDVFGGSRGTVNKDVYYNFRASKAAAIKTLRMLNNLLKSDKIIATNWYKQFPDTFAAIKELEDSLVAIADKNTNYIQLSMTCADSKEAADIVNEMQSIFTREQHRNATSDLSLKLAEATQSKNSIQREIDNAQQAMADFRKDNPNMELETISGERDIRSAAKVQRDLLERLRNELEADIDQMKSQIAILEQRANGDYDDIVKQAVESDPHVISIRQQINLLQPQLQRILSKFGENHKSVMQYREQLAKLYQDLDTRSDYIADINRKSDLQQAEDLKTTLTSKQISYNTLVTKTMDEQKDQDNIAALYENYKKVRDEKTSEIQDLDKSIRELNIQINSGKISRVNAFDTAIPPNEMASPKIILWAPGGTMLGLLIGVGIAFLIELTSDLLKSPRDVARTLHMPMLGMVCHSDEDRDLRKVDPINTVRQAPFSVSSECYRQLKTNLKFSDKTEDTKTILITSGAPGEGKTSVAVNIANSFVSEYKKVLYIDTNFRKPTSTQLFPKSVDSDGILEHSDYGLSNYLMGQCDSAKVIRTSDTSGLDVVDSGPLPPNPAELLGSDKMSKLLVELGAKYDYVILDGPPLIMSDAKSLASMVDGTLVVFNTEITRKGAAQRILRELKEVNADVIGCVLIGVRSVKGGYFKEMYETYRDYKGAGVQTMNI